MRASDDSRAWQRGGEALGLVLAGALFFHLFGCAPGVPQTLPNAELTDNSREVYARRHLIDARLLVDQERYESALRIIDRGLWLEPGNAKLHRLRAHALRALDREEEAAIAQAKADALNPVVPLSTTPVVAPEIAQDILVVLLPPPSDEHPEAPWAMDRVPTDWPQGVSGSILQERLAVRLPGAQILALDSAAYQNYVESVPQVRDWLSPHLGQTILSLRIDRAFCGKTTKDGPFAVAWLRVAIAQGNAEPLAVETLRVTVDDPTDCRGEVVARSLEAAFELDVVRDNLAAGSSDNPWHHREIRRVFPRLDFLMQAEIDAGRELLNDGEILRAAEHFRSASAIDPANISTNSLLLDLEESISLSRELSHFKTLNQDPNGWHRPAQPDKLEIYGQVSPRERRVTEDHLREEQRHLDDLQAAVVAYGRSQETAPDSVVLAALRTSEIQDFDALGPRLARSLTSKNVERRTLYAPDGSVIVRYYFAEESQQPLLGEADRDADGRPDLWIAYTGVLRSQAWQDEEGSGIPNLHMTYDDDGVLLRRVEIDRDRDGIMEQILLYEAGLVSLDSYDTTGDGHYNLVQHFDQEGDLALKEEDQNGDGEVDLRTHYRSGRMLRREVLDPDAISQDDLAAPATLGSRKPL